MCTQTKLNESFGLFPIFSHGRVKVRSDVNAQKNHSHTFPTKDHTHKNTHPFIYTTDMECSQWRHQRTSTPAPQSLVSTNPPFSRRNISPTLVSLPAEILRKILSYLIGARLTVCVRVNKDLGKTATFIFWKNNLHHSARQT